MSNATVRNNGGGFYNHCLFWDVISPSPKLISGDLADAIHNSFGSFDEFKTAFGAAASTQFGSGWAWLCVHKGGRLGLLNRESGQPLCLVLLVMGCRSWGLMFGNTPTISIIKIEDPTI